MSVCPWWLGYMLLNPFRRLFQDPHQILAKYLTKEMRVMDLGCGMGYFSLPMAELVGEQGRVLCVDLQEKMLSGLVKRAKQQGLSERIITRKCSSQSLEISEMKELDFVLAFAMVHEVPDQDRLFREIASAMKLKGKLLIAEPKGHVSEEKFQNEIKIAEQCGLKVFESPIIGRSHAAVLSKE